MTTDVFLLTCSCGKRFTMGVVRDGEAARFQHGDNPEHSVEIPMVHHRSVGGGRHIVRFDEPTSSDDWEADIEMWPAMGRVMGGRWIDALHAREVPACEVPA